MRSVPAHELQEGRAYRAANGDLLLVTRVEQLGPGLRLCLSHDRVVTGWSVGATARVSFVTLSSPDDRVAARSLGLEQRFTARAEQPDLYEEL